MASKIDIEFQPVLNRKLVSKFSQVNNQLTVGEVLNNFAENINIEHNLQAGSTITVTRAVPYHPVFCGLHPSGQLVPEPAPQSMPLSDVFSREGGLFVVDFNDEALSILTTSHLKPKKRKKKKKCMPVVLIENQDSDGPGESAKTPALIDGPGSPASAFEDPVYTDFDDMALLSDGHGSNLAGIKLMITELQKTMAEERKKAKNLEDKVNRLEKENQEERKKMEEKVNGLKKENQEERCERKKMEEKVNGLKKENQEERKKMEAKVNGLKKENQEMVNRLEKENQETANRLEKEIEKSSRLEQEIKNEQKTRSLLEVDVDDLKHSTNDIANWIVAGCQPKTGGDSGEPLRRIQIRNLLDRVQAKLAWLAKLTDGQYNRKGSGLWRTTVEGSSLTERLASARTLLEPALKLPQYVQEKPSLKVFISSDEAMRLAVEATSNFRIRGDVVAHHNLTKTQFISIVDEHRRMGGERGDELKAFVQFLFPQH